MKPPSTTNVRCGGISAAKVSGWNRAEACRDRFTVAILTTGSDLLRLFLGRASKTQD